MAEPTIDERVVAYLEGRLDAAGLAELRDELAADGAARRRFVLIVTQIGAMRAGDNLPDLPPYCTDPMPGVEPKLNEPIDGPQKRWRIVQQHENERIEWCANHYRQLQKSRAGNTLSDAAIKSF